DRIRPLLFEVEKGSRGAQLILSRSSPDLVRGLFENEVPEIYDGTVEIVAIAREAGSRTKIAVRSHDHNVDPVGACVGMKGSRVRSVVEELSGEKIDIVRWTENVDELCKNALNPADIVSLRVDQENKSIKVVVPQDQLSLAIGKRGQNARLASKLIGWNIDIEGDGSGAEESAPEESRMDTAKVGADDLGAPEV
ncbi:MAG: transcription termination/antitermination protein NusA, partial [Candidatus Hydrogenedentota bacterium]